MLWLFCCGVLPALVCLVLACLVWCCVVCWLRATVPDAACYACCGVLGVVLRAWCNAVCLVWEECLVDVMCLVWCGVLVVVWCLAWCCVLGVVLRAGCGLVCSVCAVLGVVWCAWGGVLVVVCLVW